MPRYEFPTPKERTKSGRGRASPARKPPEVKSAGGNAAQMYASQIARYIANSHPACNRNGPSEPADKKEGSIKVEGTNDASISFPFLRYRRRNVGWSRSFPHIRGVRGDGGDTHFANRVPSHFVDGGQAVKLLAAESPPITRENCSRK